VRRPSFIVWEGIVDEDTVVEHRLYFIKNEFYDKVADPCLRMNKADTKRPHYYVFKDPETNLLWMIPCSSRIEKYREIIDRCEALKKPHDRIQIIRVNGFDEAFLYQDMFPVTPDYVDSVYKNSKGVFEIKDDNDIKQVERTAVKMIKMLRHNVKFNKTQPDINRIEKMMIEELDAKGEPRE
jgi:hypothetical protein